MMSRLLTGFGVLSVVMGILTIGGSAGDCDGHCMELANDTPTMLMVIGYGLIMLIGGGACIAIGERMK